MCDLEIFKDILNDPVDINPVKYYQNSIFINEENTNNEYIKNLEEEIKKLKNYLHISFQICEKLKKIYESEIVLRIQNKNK